MTQFDIVIIGAGSAGCVLANRLSADGRFNVALIEAGGSDRSLWIEMPIGYGATFHHPRLNWCYQSESVPGLNGRKSYCPRGKVLGGSSSINAMVYIRGQAEDFDHWRDLGNPGWGYADLLPYFQRMEIVAETTDPLRGTQGPIHVNIPEQSVHPLSKRFVDAAQSLGLPLNHGFNGATQDGVGLYEINTVNGRRCSAAKAYLRPALHRPNLTLFRHAHVDRLLLRDGRVTGVEMTYQGRSQKIEAGEVILSAGAIGSPAILERSGIGDGAHLSQIGIETVRHLPGIGANLQDHIGFDYIYRSKVATLNDTLRPLFWRGLAGVQYLLTRSGPLSLSINQAGGFCRSSPDRERLNMQLYFSPLSYTRAVPGKRRLTAPDRFSGMMIGVSNCHPRSRGWVHATSTDPNAPPKIQPNHLDDPHDLEELAEVCHMLRRIADTPLFRDVIDVELKPGKDVTALEQIAADIRDRAGSVFHLCGTCAMGPDPQAGAVVDARLRVHGVSGLRVVDASVFPTITSGNLNAPVMMVGERASDLILDDLK